MPLILGLIGVIVATFVALAWVAVWLIAAVVWLVWPLALLILGGVMWRRQARTWHRLQSAPAAGPQRERAFFKESGNATFDEYRNETLRRLDEEREKFRDFLEQRRKAKDREAFDRYVSERWERHSNGPQRAIG
jgi:hypothetical protein